MTRRRISAETAAVLSVVLASPQRALYGLEIRERSGIASGSLYPILIRLEDRGVLQSERAKQKDPSTRGRPRTYYRLTASGRRAAAEDLTRWEREQARRARAFRGPAVGAT